MTDPKPHGADNADPPTAPTAMVLRIVAAERDYVDGQVGIMEERFRGLDRAQSLLATTVNRTPTEIEKEISHVTSIMSERFSSVQKQFDERDTRSEREARDNKLAVDAAFAAQEKQAVAQNEGNNLAITKSENATAETIKTNQDLSKSEINSLRKSGEDQKLRQTEVDEDMKKRLGALELAMVTVNTSRSTTREVQVERRENTAQMIAIAAIVAALLGSALGAILLKVLGG